jgi:hypothetical protein
MSSDTPRELGGPGRSVVRLNRRVIYVVGGVLVLALVAGLVAIHEQGKRLTEPSAERRRALPALVPGHSGPGADATSHGTDTASSPASQASPKAPTGDEDEAQRQRRVLRAPR